MNADIDNIQKPAGDRPAGFCPFCDYQVMGPGVCSECGKEIFINRIRISARSTARRVLIRRLLVILFGIGCTFGGYKFYKGGAWKPWIPTDCLLWFQPSEGWAKDQLVSRLIDGRLSDAQVDKLLEGTFGVDLEIRSPRPKDIPLRFRLKLPSSCGCYNSLNVTSDSFIDSVLVNGVKRATENNEPEPGVEKITNRPLSAHREFSLSDTLTPGYYEIEVQGEYGIIIDSTIGNNPRTGSRLSRSFELRQTVVVEDKPVNSFEEYLYNEELVDVVRNQLRVSFCKRSDNRAGNCAVRMDSVPENIVGKLLFLAPEEPTPNYELDLIIKKSSRSKATRECFPLSNGFGATTRVRFIPDPVEAFEQNYADMFGGVLEWKIDPNEIEASTLATRDWWLCQSCDSPFAREADEVYEWNAYEAK